MTLDLLDASREPELEELRRYVGMPQFDALLVRMDADYAASAQAQYSRDVWYPGWNLKFRKAGRALCAVYPRQGGFTALVVVGAQEKARVELLLPALTEAVQRCYRETREGGGQRWLMIDVTNDDVLRDLLELVRIRRERPKPETKK